MPQRTQTKDRYHIMEILPFMLFVVYLRESALSAREYSHKSTQAIAKEETPMSLADYADNRRQTSKLH
ncbi:hypothetical protein [Prevotella sp.]|uniref:hypothetical protein n=1 Tax=Prevotella sp. TaxID=59823 RepID=UPI002648030B|nr:hypothetical protein [Prevotella sp.]MDN5554331.1 hypothetical protein [Prevotella sp.]